MSETQTDGNSKELDADLNADTTPPAPTEIETLKARADLMGITYHPSIGLEKLREKVLAAMADEKPPATSDAPPESDPVVEAPVVETEGQKRVRMRNHLLALVRVRIQCMDPLKKDWPGEIISVGNNLVKNVSKFIPYMDAEDGYHIPYIIYQHLLERQCQVFTTTTDARGNKSRTGRLIRAFAIELLPDLTPEELRDLAQRQAMAKSID